MSNATALALIFKLYEFHIGLADKRTKSTLEKAYYLLNEGRIDGKFHMVKFIEMIGKRKPEARNLNELLRAIEIWLDISEYTKLEKKLHNMRVKITSKAA